MAQKKEYRSAVRSRRLIRQALMELLQEKDCSLDQVSQHVAVIIRDSASSVLDGGPGSKNH